MNVNGKAMLVALNISVWRGQVTDRDASREVDEIHGAHDSGKFIKNLIAKQHINKILSRAQAARSVHKFYTLPWDDEGQRILPVDLFYTYRDAITQEENRFNAEVEKFLSYYDTYVQEARIKLGSLWDENDYPDKEDIRGKFEMAVAISPLPSAEDFRTSLHKEDQDIIKQHIEERVGETIENSVVYMAEKINSLAGKLAEQIESLRNGNKRALKKGSLTEIRELAEILPSLNLTGNERINTIAKDIKKMVSIDIDDIKRSPEQANDIKRQAEEIVRKMKTYL